MSERLLKEIEKRLPHFSIEDRDMLNTFSETYDAKVTIKSFVGYNVLFTDLQGRTVCVVGGERSDDMIQVIPSPDADIVVIGLGADRMMVGWADVSKFIDAGDIWLIDIGELSPMPDELNFAQRCPHGAIYGMWRDQDSDKWTCFGCGGLIASVRRD